MTLLELLAGAATVTSCATAFYYRSRAQSLERRLIVAESAKIQHQNELETSRGVEAELREKTHIHEAILNALCDAGIQLMLIENGRIAYVGNRKLAHQAGWRDAEIDACPPLLDIIHPDDRARVADNYRRRLAGEAVPGRYEVALLGRDGGRVEYEVAAGLVRGSAPPRVITVSWDISERKRAERDLLLLRRAIGQTSEGFFLMDEQWRVIDTNAAACTSLELRREELLGLTPLDFDPGIAREVLDSLMAREAGQSHTFESRHRARDGRTFPVEVSSSIFLDGDRRYVVAMTRDISERKRLEAETERSDREFRTLVENLPDPVFRFDKECHRLYVNAAAGHITGRAVAELLGGTPLDGKVVNQVCAEAATRQIRRVFATGEPASLDVTYPAPDDTEREFSMLIVPEFDDDGNVVTALGLAHEVTALRDAERRAGAFLANTPGFIYTMRRDCAGRVSLPFASAGLEATFGIAVSALQKSIEPLRALCHPTDRVRVEAEFAHSAAHRTPVRVEVRIQTVAHQEIWLESHATPAIQANGEVFWHGIAFDVTERKRAEAALARQEREFRTLAENLPVALIRYDLAQRRRYLNPAAERMLRAAPHELLGQLPGGATLPATPAAVARYRAKIDEALTTGITQEHEFVLDALPPSEQEYYDVIIVPEPVAEGGVGGALAIWYDVTARKRMEVEIDRERASLRAYFDALPDLAWMKDAEGRYLACNRVFERFFGASEADIRGMTDFDFVDATLAASFRANDLAAIAAAKPSVNEEWITFADDGRHALLETTKAPVRDTKGNLIGVLGVGRDITERRAAEQAREAAYTEAKRLDEIRSTFMSQMSHELRTPLNGILGFAQLMQRECFRSCEHRDRLEIIRDNGEHLLALVNQVLDFSRIEAGKLGLKVEDLELPRFLDMLTATIRISAERKHIGFALIPAPDLPVCIRTDGLRLRQILLNLLGNAVKFTDQGRIEFHVSQPAPDRMRFEIRDTGIGIPAGQHESIFEAFEQIAEGSRLREGTGLGLTISRKLARMMGGDISVESRRGEGSTFVLELDVANGNEAAGMCATIESTVSEDGAAAAATPAEPEQCTLPSVSALDELLEMARRGYLRVIARGAAELGAEHVAFGDHLARLALAYRSQEVISYLERCRERAAKQ